MVSSFLNAEAAAVAPKRFVIAGMDGCAKCAACEVRARGICSALDDGELTQLANVAVKVTLPPGRIFIEEGTDADELFNITSGVVKLFKSLPDGRRQITGFVGVGHFLGLAVSDRYAFSAETVDQVRLCRFSRRKLETAIDEFPRLERRLLNEAANELVTAQEQMLLLGRKTARERVASFLYSQLLSEYGLDIPDGGKLHFPMTRADIADFLGLTVETVSRTISSLRREKIIAMESGQEIRVPFPSQILEISRGERHS